LGYVVQLTLASSTVDSYVVYFDNFFTSLELLQHLTMLNIHGTDAVHANRIKYCDLAYVDQFKKFVCGTEEQRLDIQSNIIVTRWKDNSVQKSSRHGKEPISAIQVRYNGG
jgi:hypothetical protein